MLRTARNAAIALVLASAPAAAEDAPAKPQETLAYSIGIQAYIYGYPMMDLWRTFWEGTLDPDRGHDIGLNQFNFSRKLVSPADDWVVTPNNDTLYNRAFFDLTAEPVILRIPKMDRKYWFPIGDMFHNLNASVSWDTVGFSGGNFALVGPGWSGTLPTGIKRVDVKTPMVWTVGRYAVSGTDDVAGANALQDGTTLTPLSTFSGTPAPAQPLAYPKLTRDDLTDPKAFFTTLNEMLRRNPPPPRDAGLMALFGEIGLAPEQRFDWDTLSEPAKAGLTRAARDGLAIINDRIANYSDVINGWSVAILDADMSDRPVDHAAAARLGLLYSQKEVSTYHVSLFDADSKPLDGTNSYELRFAPIPPVNAFWSVTMYDGTTKILIDNPINRYSVGDRTPGLIYGNDDKTEIVITISNTEPTDATARANWLPAPKGPFYLTLREYSPAPAILTRDWVPPAIHKVE